MKKSLIALAALSAFATAAQAQSSVTVYGTVDVAVSVTEFSANTATVTNGLNPRKTMNTGNGDGALSTSILGFRGTEDLGGGTKANFVIEWDLTDAGAGGGAAATNARTSAALGARQSWLGLDDSKLGQLRLGRQFTASHGVVAGFSAGFANNVVGTVYSASGPQLGTGRSVNELGMRPHNVFADRIVTYISPVFSGTTLTVQLGDIDNGQATLEERSKVTDVSLIHRSGKLALGASQQETKTTSRTALSPVDSGTAASAGLTAANIGGSTVFVKDMPAGTAGQTITMKATAFGASYDFGFVQPFALHTIKEVSSDVSSAGKFQKQKATEIGLRAPITSKISAFASMYDGENQGSANLAKTEDLSGYQAGVTYAFSKRTTAYAVTGQQELTGKTGTTYNAKVTGTSVGLRHTF